jgi:hypothetical protein
MHTNWAPWQTNASDHNICNKVLDDDTVAPTVKHIQYCEARLKAVNITLADCKSTYANVEATSNDDMNNYLLRLVCGHGSRRTHQWMQIPVKHWLCLLPAALKVSLIAKWGYCTRFIGANALDALWTSQSYPFSATISYNSSKKQMLWSQQWWERFATHGCRAKYTRYVTHG